MTKSFPNVTCRRGFTLLELLITITLLGVVMVILAQATTLSLQTWEKGTASQFANQQTSVVTDMLSQQLRSAYPLRIPITKEDGTQDLSKKLLVFDGNQESVAFVTTKPLGIESQAGLHLVVYYLEREKDSPTSQLIAAYRSVYHRKFYESPFTDDEKTQLLSDVTTLKLEYFDGQSGTWVPEWIIKDPTQPLPTVDPENPDALFPLLPKTTLPSAVKLHLEQGSKRSPTISDLLIPIMTQGKNAEKAGSKKAAGDVADNNDDEDDFFDDEDEDD